MQDTNTHRMLHNIEDTREILGSVGRTTIYELINEGALKRVKIRSRSFITDKSIQAYVGELENAALITD